MRTATLTIKGLLIADPDLFTDNLNLPTGVDFDTAVGWIIREAEPFEVIYPDAAYMAYHIQMWSLGRLAAWEKLYATESFVYNPIENYNMQDHWTDTGSGEYSSSGDNSITTEQAAFDGSTLKKTEEVSGEHSEEGDNSSTLEHYQQRSGNIGTMTTQQMIMQERQIADYSIYKQIADEFKKEFCIMIY